MKRKTGIILGCSIVALISLMTATYNIVLNNKTKKQGNETPVLSYDNKELREDLVIALYTGEKLEKTLSLDMFKEKYGVEKMITEEVIKEALKDEGYALDNKGEKVFSFKKDKEKAKEKNKYHIGEKDGYLAIFKSDENGDMHIVTQYETSLDLIRLRPEEYERIRSKTYFSSESLAEVEDEMSGLNS
ncbi:MAG: hypothetical protein ACRDAU_15670 [Clostridium sp.]